MTTAKGITYKHCPLVDKIVLHRRIGYPHNALHVHLSLCIHGGIDSKIPYGYQNL